MKTFIVICLLAAFGEARPGQRFPSPDEFDGTALHPCASFKETVQKNMRSISNIEFNDYPEDIRTLAHKIKAFSEAASKCIPNNATFRNAHSAVDSILTLVLQYPTKAKILKSIASAQDFMDEHFDDLQATSMGFDLSSDLRTEIDEFVKRNVQKAVKVFHKHEGVSSQLDEDVIPTVILLGIAMDRLVDKVDHCLKIAPSAYESIFDHRRGVRLATRHLQHEISHLRFIAKEKFSLWEKLIGDLLHSFSEELKQLNLKVFHEKFPLPETTTKTELIVEELTEGVEENSIDEGEEGYYQ